MRIVSRALLIAVSLTVATVAPALAQSIDYVVRFPDRERNLVEVEATIPTGGAREVVLFMPVWTPGSYLVREFARNVQEIEARTGETSLPLEKITKNRWRVQTGGARQFTLRYRLYARELSVRTNFVESRFAILNGASTFITRVDALRLPHRVRLELPSDWTRSASAMPSSSSDSYTASDYDQLVDSPIVAGDLDIREIRAGGATHHLVSFGDLRFVDMAMVTRDIERIAREHFVMWRSLPYDHYWIFNAVVEASGGLEHADSTLIMTNRFLTRSRASYVRWLETVAHEFSHVWNVKRLRPAALTQYDYENESYTRELWFAEGITDYYGSLLPSRAGVFTEDEYLSSLSQQIRTLETTPGRELQSLEDSSFDAWIRAYRPDENSPNVSVSYYTKGHVVAFLLDAAIRRETRNMRSLDDVMRLAHERLIDRGISRQTFESILAEVGSKELVPLARHMLTTTAALGYRPALEYFGLRFRADPSPSRADLGITTSVANGRISVRTPLREGAAWKAGLQSEDEILAIDRVRVLPEALDSRLWSYAPGDRIEVLVARRGAIIEIPVVLGATSSSSWRLEPDPGASPVQLANRAAWMGGSGR